MDKCFKKLEMSIVAVAEKLIDVDSKVEAMTTKLAAIDDAVQELKKAPPGRDANLDEGGKNYGDTGGFLSHVRQPFDSESAMGGFREPPEVHAPTPLAGFKEESPSVVYVGRGDIFNNIPERIVKQKAERKAAMIFQRAKSDRLKKLGPTQKSPFTGNKTVKQIISGKPPGQGYDPFAKVDKQKVIVLDDWLKLDMKLPFGTSNSSVSWFDTLRTPTKWLNDMHMDAALNLLRLRYLKHPEWFRSDRICFLDCLFQQMWAAKFKLFLASGTDDDSERLLPEGSFQYHSGEKPAYCRTKKAWGSEVDDIYSPLHVVDHWVALWISIPKRHIVIWDSDVYHLSDDEVDNAIKPFTHMLPYLLHLAADESEKVKYTCDAFTYERIKGKGVPRNLQSGDCGVYTLKYIECHSLGLPFPKSLCDGNMKEIRLKLAAEIFDETGIRGDEKGDLDLFQ